MVKNITEQFEKTMKKGFLNIFVLLVLDKDPTHGYNLKKLIEERTGGFWTPPDSTIYTILKDLRDKDLIRIKEEKDPDDSRKVYELTEGGKKALNLLRKKEEEMRDSLRSIIYASTDLTDPFFERTIQDFILRGPPKFFGHNSMKFSNHFLEKFHELPENEQLTLLKKRKSFISNQIKRLTQILNNIDGKISELESNKKIKN